METNSYGILQAAVSAAEKAYDGDDFDLMWSFERDAAGTSHGKVNGVEGVEGGFWVNARVWVSDADIEQDIARAVKAELRETLPPPEKEPAIYLGPQEIKDHFDGDETDQEVAVFAATYDELLDVGRDALGDDRFWRAFHEVLVDVVTEKLLVKKDRVARADAAVEREVDEAIAANASRRVQLKYGSRVRHARGEPEGSVVIVHDRPDFYTVRWDSGVEERIAGDELVYIFPPRPTLPLFDSKLEDTIKDVRALFELAERRRQDAGKLADEINQLAMVLDAVLYQPQLMIVDRAQHRKTLWRIRERVAELIEP